MRFSCLNIFVDLSSIDQKKPSAFEISRSEAVNFLPMIVKPARATLDRVPSTAIAFMQLPHTVAFDLPRLVSG